jgi:hypothetical protein
MKSPLQTIEAVSKKYGITDEIDVPPVMKLSYLESQYQEIQHTLWRSLVDSVHATRLAESDNEVLKAKGNNNYAQHVNEVQQFVGALKMLNVFMAELKEKYPELKAED